MSFPLHYRPVALPRGPGEAGTLFAEARAAPGAFKGSIGIKPMTLDDEEFFRDLGHRLRSRREGLGWTQVELARRCDLKAYIGFVGRGERNVSLINPRRIARVLCVGLSEVMKALDRPARPGFAGVNAATC
jgi:hypothetical protein